MLYVVPKAGATAVCYLIRPAHVLIVSEDQRKQMLQWVTASRGGRNLNSHWLSILIATANRCFVKEAAWRTILVPQRVVPCRT